MDDTIYMTWPYCTLFTDLGINPPKNYGQQLFSTSYDFYKVVIAGCLLLDRQITVNLYQSFINALRTTINFPIETLEKLTGSKSYFTGRLGFVELLFRGTIKKKKRKIGSWYNTDLKIPYHFTNTNNQFKSDTFKLFGIDRALFEQTYYQEIGIPPSFELILIQRLDSTRSGPYYANLIPLDKRDRLNESTAIQLGTINPEHRFVVKNEKLIKNVLNIINIYRDPPPSPVKLEKMKIDKPPGSQTPSKKIASSSIPSSTRKQVWKVYNGNVGSAGCFVCNSMITALDYECGHIIPRSKGGENIIDNLLPICGTCNKAMSDTHLFEHVRVNFGKINSRCKLLPSYTEWCKKH
jgi:hypothetical protein